MNAPRNERPPNGTPSARDDRVREAAQALRRAIRESGEGPTRHPAGRDRRAIAPGGLVLLIDDGRGVARAVGADLRALGHPVARVRHGVGEPGVEGLNLASPLAVAALIDRLKLQGPLSAIVYLAHPDGRDDPRPLALLAQAACEDLARAASEGGACLVVASDLQGGRAGDAPLDRWLRLSSGGLPGVRVRTVPGRRDKDAEVFAAEVVRAVLGTDEARPERAPSGGADEAGSGPPRPRSEAFLLGAPDRASWMHVAAALADWLDDAPGVRPADLAWTLHRDQPDYPFRVGLVASSGPDLADRLRRVVSRLAEPGREAILDPSEGYWVDREPGQRGRSRPRRARFGGRLDLRLPDRQSHPAGGVALPHWTGREWISHLVAWRFADGDRFRPESLLLGREARMLDLSMPGAGIAAGPGDAAGPSESPALLRAVDALDEVLEARKEAISAWLAEAVDP